MASSSNDLTCFLLILGKPVRQKRKMKNIEAVKNRKKMRQNGVKLCRATFVAINESPQNSTASTRAIYVNTKFPPFTLPYRFKEFPECIQDSYPFFSHKKLPLQA